MIKIMEKVQPLPFLSENEKKVFLLGRDLAIASIKDYKEVKAKKTISPTNVDLPAFGTVDFNDVCLRVFGGRGIKN